MRPRQTAIGQNQLPETWSGEFRSIFVGIELVGDTIGVEIDNIVSFNIYQIVSEWFINIHLCTNWHTVGFVLNKLTATQEQQRPERAGILKALRLRVVDA